jgi:SAM-dependent methyltransferase
MAASAVACLEAICRDGLEGDLRVGDFTRLPWDEGTFDIAFDRGALTNCGLSMGRMAVREIRRVLRPGGKFYFNPYSVMHSSHVAGRQGPDEVTQDISSGGLEGMGAICLLQRASAPAEGWRILSMVHVERSDVLRPIHRPQSGARFVRRRPEAGQILRRLGPGAA